MMNFDANLRVVANTFIFDKSFSEKPVGWVEDVFGSNDTIWNIIQIRSLHCNAMAM